MPDPAEMNMREELLDRCVGFHGHLCVGQVLGVRLAIKGMELTGVSSARDMIVLIENDRCIADAIQIVTGTRFGRRTAKLMNVGKMAATFLNTRTGCAWRVNVHRLGMPPEPDHDSVRAILRIPDDELLAWKRVGMVLKPEELPGKPQRTVNCTRCGERVFDGKDVPGDEGPLCLSCAEGAYYTVPVDDSR